ncbi:MAG: hypothetical protein Q9226_000775 [Calogaya cf. arnoldii]
MMFRFILLAQLATHVLGGPLSNTRSVFEARSAAASSPYITSCEAAVNCETYVDPVFNRTLVRFKSGTEPGTEDYAARFPNPITKRRLLSPNPFPNGDNPFPNVDPFTDKSPHTVVTVSDDKILWGCDTDPVAILDHVGDICATSGHCISNKPYTQEVNYVEPKNNYPSTQTLTIKAEGFYPSWMRNGMVQAIQAVMSTEDFITKEDLNYIVGFSPATKDGQEIKSAKCSVATAPAFIGVSVYNAAGSAEGPIRANIAVEIAVGTPEKGFCAGGTKDITAISAAVTSAFGPIGAGFAAIFGTISASCDAAAG